MSNKMGVVLSGGGARGAYQVGVLKALAELSPEGRIPVITGFSAGALNASFLASEIHNFGAAVRKLESVWSSIRPEQVFKTDPWSLFRDGLQLIWDLSFGGIHRHTTAQALLDTRPLRKLLSDNTNYENIHRNIDSGVIDALAVFATDYGTAESVTFYEENSGEIVPWGRKRRKGVRVRFSVDHIMASAALPLLFPSIEVGGSFFGDGCLRNVAPLSPAIHLGADRLLIVGVRRQKEEALEDNRPAFKPALGRVLGVVLNAILLDTTDMDVERMQRINNTLSKLSESDRSKVKLRSIEHVWVTPSQDIGQIATAHVHRLPFFLRYLLRGTGSRAESAEIASYLLFDSEFCRSLIDLGYHDAMNQKERLMRLVVGE